MLKDKLNELEIFPTDEFINSVTEIWNGFEKNGFLIKETDIVNFIKKRYNEDQSPDKVELIEKLRKAKLKSITKAQKPGRNEKCFCGSGKKFKHCCISKFK